MGNNALIELYKRIIVGSRKSWVLFEHGTCVIVMNPGTDIQKQALEILSEYGPARVASSSGDFSVVSLKGERGWIVGGHHPDALTYVSPEELGEHPTEVAIGVIGRSKRNSDSEHPSIIHVEDKRNAY